MGSKELHMMHLGGWGTAGTFVMTVGMLVIVAVAVAAIVLLLRPVFSAGRPSADPAPATGPGEYGTGSRDAELNQLEERYARGEIGRDEFLARKADLQMEKRPFER